MGMEFVHRTEHLFQLDTDIRKAELTRDKRLLHIKILDGLQESCLLLREMLDSDSLGRANYDPETWQYFKDLKEQNKLDWFLDLERKFLGATALGPDTANVIVSALRQALELMIARQGHLDAPWQSLLAEVSRVVCEKASTEAQALGRRPLIRRAFLAAGGSVVTMLNLFPAPHFSMTPQVSAGSVSLGLWLIGHAAGGVLDQWADGGMRN